VKVVDASVIAAFILKEPGWEKMASIVSKSATVDHALKEVLNAIWKANKKGYISKRNAEVKAKILKDLFDYNLEVINEEQIALEAFRIALIKNISVYDSLYIALAKKLNAKLYTLDKKQAEKSKNIVEAELLEQV